MTIGVRGAVLAVLMLVGAVSGGGAGPARAGASIVWTYPGCAAQQGRPPAPDTLQGCIGGAGSGETILIATDTAVNEQASITDKTLNLGAAPGWHPEITGGLVYSVSAGTQALEVRGIHFEGQVAVYLEGGSAHRILFDQVVVHETSGSPPEGILVITAVPANVTVTRSRVSTTLPGAEGIRFQASNDTGVASFRVVGSRIDGRAGGNRSGIVARGYGAGSFDVDLYNDVIFAVGNCHCAGSDGIDASLTDNVHARFRAAGLTIDTSGGNGLDIDTKYLTGGSATVYLYDSIFTRAAGSAIAIASPPVASSLTFHAGYNDFSGNGAPNHLGGRSIGSHNRSLAPRYVNGSNGNLRLRSSSPLIDIGQVCSPGGIADPDPDGHHRLQGKSVDLGAYEHGAATPTGTVVSGTKGADSAIGTEGADIFCGYAGADDFAGRGGADYMDGGGGGDFLAGEAGADRLFGEGGADILCGADGSGTDLLNGGRGTDLYDFDTGDALVSVENLFRPCHD